MKNKIMNVQRDQITTSSAYDGHHDATPHGSDRPLILLTNDDGYDAAGLQALRRAAQMVGETWVVAPEGARSGAACSISSTGTVALRTVDAEAHIHACTGTPVDCVKLALEHVVPRRPVLVLSGINHGDNASISIHYSGTMGAVLEACMKGITAVGVSLYLRRGETYADHPVSDATIEALGCLLRRVVAQGLPQDTCLNINLPPRELLTGWRLCRQARGSWSAEWADAHHPFGGRHYWLTGTFTNLEPDATDTDFAALRDGAASVVPISVDMTAHEALRSLVL